MQITGQAAAPAGNGAAAVIKDGDLASFSRDVIQASMRVPVLVDFWAPWCGPCKQLTPVLEKVVKAAAGKVQLVKINVDENPELAQQLRIQSIPTVYAFVGGQPVTGFAGAQPESQIKALIERLIGGPAGGADLQAVLEEAGAMMAEGAVVEAGQIYARILEEDPENLPATAGLARCLIAQGQHAEAKALLDKVPVAQQGSTEIAGAKAALQLATESGKIQDWARLEARLSQDPADHDARLQLATALFLRGQIEPAIEHLLKIIKADRTWNDDAGRKQLLKMFDALGPKHPAVAKGRRALSAVLFS